MALGTAGGPPLPAEAGHATHWLGAAVASAAGLPSLEPVGEIPGLYTVDVGNGPFLLATEVFAPAAPASAEVTALERAIGRVLGARAHVVHVRQHVPPGADVDEVARALELWLRRHDDAIARTVWYEGQGIDVDVWISGRTRSGPGRLGRVPPLDAERRLRLISGWMVHVVGATQRFSTAPIVFVAGIDGPWRLPLGQRLRVFYGAFGQADVSPGVATFVARRDADALFSYRPLRRVMAVWWVERYEARVRMSCFENPWVPQLVGCPGARLGASHADDRAATLSWRAGIVSWPIGAPS
jgi:hypothetical protein